MKKFIKELYRKIEVVLWGWLYAIPEFKRIPWIIFNRLMYVIYPKYKFNKDKKEKTFWDYTYYNFNNFIKGWEFWFERYIEDKKLRKNCEHIDFFQVFWPKKNLKYSTNKKIFVTYEYIWKDRFPSYDDYCLWKVDFSIWFRKYDRKDYYRFPLWLCTLIEPEETSLDQIKKKIEKLESEKTKFKKDKFACLIASHDDKGRVRTKTYNLLSSVWTIWCPWLLLHNIDVKIPKYEDKINFMKEYKFNICPENKYYEWYVTEKLVDAIKAGCIPIYYGAFNKFDEKIFNKDRILFCDDINLEKKVKELNSNKEKYLEFIKQPIFKENVADIIFEYIENFDSKFRKIF